MRTPLDIYPAPESVALIHADATHLVGAAAWAACAQLEANGSFEHGGTLHGGTSALHNDQTIRDVATVNDEPINGYRHVYADGAPIELWTDEDEFTRQCEVAVNFYPAQTIPGYDAPSRFTRQLSTDRLGISSDGKAYVNGHRDHTMVHTHMGRVEDGSFGTDLQEPSPAKFLAADVQRLRVAGSIVNAVRTGWEVDNIRLTKLMSELGNTHDELLRLGSPEPEAKSSSEYWFLGVVGTEFIRGRTNLAHYGDRRAYGRNPHHEPWHYNDIASRRQQRIRQLEAAKKERAFRVLLRETNYSSRFVDQTDMTRANQINVFRPTR
jgi:hypothetical protein